MKVLNLDRSYKEFYGNSSIKNQASLNSLQNNLKDYKMYIDSFQQRLEKENNNRNGDKNRSYIGKLFNLKNVNKKSNDDDNLRSYLNTHVNTTSRNLNHLNLVGCIDNRLSGQFNLNQSNQNNQFIDAQLAKQSNHIKTNAFNNQQLASELQELRTKRKLNQRIQLNDYFRRQNFCNCKNRSYLQWINLKEEDDLGDDLTHTNLQCYSSRSYSKNSSASSDTSSHLTRTRINSEIVKKLRLDKDNLIDLSYADTAKSNEEYQNTLSEQQDEDQYLDTYTIESANTEDNPISTENYTKLIKKLTYSDAMRLKLLELCNQYDALDFDDEFSIGRYPTILNLDSGTFAVTFLAIDKYQNLIVLKVIRTIAKEIQNRLSQLTYSGTETFDEVYNEVMISKTLSNLHHTKLNRTHCFPQILFTRLVKGRIPDNFNITKLKDTKPDQHRCLTLEQFFNILKDNKALKRTKSTLLNDRKKFVKQEPFKLFPDAPVEYAVIAMKYVGKPIWKRLLNRQLNAQQLFSVAQQLIFGLACAEQQFNFEHRDLHISNILIKRTKKPEIEFILNNQIYKLSTHGYRCFIVDMTFSRLTVNNQIFFKDLSNVLYKRQDENKKLKMQDMVYQLMRDEIGDNWQKFRPRTNLHWLIYVLKTIKSCELFKKNNDLISQLLADYFNYANQCANLTELIDFIVEKIIIAEKSENSMMIFKKIT